MYCIRAAASFRMIVVWNACCRRFSTATCRFVGGGTGRRRCHYLYDRDNHNHNPSFQTDLRWKLGQQRQPAAAAAAAVRFLSISSSSSPRTIISSSSRKEKEHEIPEAHIVRERISINQARHEEDDRILAKLEQDLDAALERHAAAVAAADPSNNCTNSSSSTTTTTNNNNDNEYQSSLQELRQCYENLTYWDEALRVEQELYASFIDAPTTDDERAGSLYRQGKFHMRLQQTSTATRFYHEALELYQSSLMMLDDSDTNKDCNLAAADRRTAVAAAIGNIRISMAGVYYYRDHFDAALRHLVEAEAYFQPSKNNINDKPHVDLIKCLQHQGLVYRTMEDCPLALQRYQAAWDVLEQLQQQQCRDGDDNDDDTTHSPVLPRERRQALLLDLADMHSACGAFDPAVQLYHQILDEDRTHRGNDEETALDGVIRHNLGKIHARRNELDAARTELRRAVAIKVRFGGEFSPEVAKSLNALGAVCAVTTTSTTENQVEALQCFQRSLLIARAHATSENDPQVMFALRNIAVLKGDKVAKWGSEDDCE
jgi:tetratricopeptide (TPR) repeat protein